MTKRVKAGEWVGGEDLKSFAEKIGIDWLISTDEVRELFGVSPARIMGLISSGRILAVKFSATCWAIPVDAQGKPFVKIPSRGPQPKWVEKANTLVYTYRSGPKGKTIHDRLDEIDKQLEAVGT